MVLQQLAKLLYSRPHPRISPANSLLARSILLVSSDIHEAALSNSQYLAQKDLKEMQEKRLLRLIGHAQNTSPFYAEYLRGVHSLDDFHRLAPVRKEDMRRAFDDRRLINRDLSGFAIPQFTSGSTGVPFHFFMDKNMLARRRSMYRRLLSWTGKTEGDIVVLLMPREHPGLETENSLFACGSPQDIENLRDELYRSLEGRSVILQSRMSQLRRLAQLLEEEGKHFNFKAIISYTEELLPDTRRYLERVFQAPVFNYYACNELGPIAQECEFHDGLHVNSEWAYVEIENQDNKHVSGEEAGDVVLTDFENEVMPFVKYKLGDRGRWIDGPCRCGRTLPRLKIEGREDHAFLLSNGKIGYFAELMWPVVQRINKILQYQIIRRSMADFAIKLKPA